jgi:hypothetical protein
MKDFYREQGARKDHLFSQDHFMLDLRNMQLCGVETVEQTGNILI